MAKLTTEQTMLRAKFHEKKGEVDQACLLYKTILDAFPNNKRAQQALAALNEPKSVVSNKGTNPPQDQLEALVALYNEGRLNAAVEKAQLLVLDFPSSFLLWNILGAANLGLGKLSKAEVGFRKAAELNPNYADAHNNMGNVLQDQGKLDEAIAAYQRALKLKPNHAEAHNNMGNALQDQGKLDDAIAAYQRALKLKPDYADAHNNMGNALQDQGKLDDAIAAYQHALKIKPDYAEAHNNMGNVLKNQGKLDAAIEAYQRALKIKPDYKDAHYNMGNSLKNQEKLDEAIEAYQRALNIKPDYAESEVEMLHQLSHICDWSQIDLLNDTCAQLGITTKAVSSFAMLAIEDNAERQLMRSRIWASEKYKQAPLPLPAKPTVRPKRLKIGYFSADFHDHATLYLMAGLLRDYDSAQFELFIYSYGRIISGEWRQRQNKMSTIFLMSQMPRIM